MENHTRTDVVVLHASTPACPWQRLWKKIVAQEVAMVNRVYI